MFKFKNNILSPQHRTPDITGKIHRYDLLVTLNAKSEHYATQRVVAVMIGSIFARMSNRKLTMKVAKKDGGHGFIEDLAYRMYFNF